MPTAPIPIYVKLSIGISHIAKIRLNFWLELQIFCPVIGLSFPNSHVVDIKRAQIDEKLALTLSSLLYSFYAAII